MGKAPRTMSEIGDLALEVRRRWMAQGILGREISAAEVEALETRVGPLPSAFKSLLSLAGAQADDDEEGVLFWPPEEVCPAREVLSKEGYRLLGADDAIVIADYMQESWWYALWTRGEKRGQVFLVRGEWQEEPLDPIGDLAGFLVAYLFEPSRLYPPG